MLKVDKINVYYGHVYALKDVSVEVSQGQIASIIGANGAGKTSLLKCISGLVKPTSGNMTFMGEKLVSRPEKVVSKGIAHVPEGRRVFSGLTVEENLFLGGYLLNPEMLKENLKNIYNLFPILKKRKNQFAGTLSGGEQQMLAIGRGLMSNPKLILLDEPSLGLAPIIVNTVFDLIKQIRDNGITVLLVEQNANRALAIADKAYVLENGKIVMEGTGSELLKSNEVKKAYLGENVKNN
ncbi:ABC transporter ATP-binding protein [Thermoanaerobacterium thermosaccharolyticum]|uniref:ABC transporter ATP-binding protein n=1 Tax=Thermoanaerobacterium thermosaccharolyticum TaxID=1517 RepID=UPI003DA84C14